MQSKFVVLLECVNARTLAGELVVMVVGEVPSVAALVRVPRKTAIPGIRALATESI